jgi:nicotinate-nucleotide adenylyltransferase
MAGLIGVFGGTFDPPHYGHLILAEEARAALDLEVVYWVLTPRSPLKPDQPISPLAVRLEMLMAAIADNPAFQFSRADMDRQPPYYALGTMEWLYAHEPGRRFAYLIGSDSLHDLPRWYKPEAFLERCDLLGVMHRPGVQLDLRALEEALPGLRGKVQFFDVPLVEISGHDIRRRVREGRPYRYFVPDAVRTIIEAQGLYR